jgi:hypothetical protein
MKAISLERVLRRKQGHVLGRKEILEWNACVKGDMIPVLTQGEEIGEGCGRESSFIGAEKFVSRERAMPQHGVSTHMIIFPGGM